MKKSLHVMLVLLFITFGAYAQTKVNGVVKDQQGQPLIGASVKVKGSTMGTSTDAQGSFSINVPGNSTLIVSYAGYKTQEVSVNNKTQLNIVLAEDAKVLGEVVVTALGIKKERRSLGYAATEVQGESLTQARETNITNSLVGKVAGLDVNSTSGGPGSSTNIIIRGASSLGQSNQPLYVIDGIPMESQPRANVGSQWDNAPDLGDDIGNINPDDIESISVLKGAAASALYGYRAKAGVILITTKNGKGNGIEFNSNYVAEQIIDMTDWQYVYGQGANNIKPASQNAAFTSGQSSYGAKLDGSNVIQFDGVSRPYTAQKNNLENFYRNGGTWTNTIAVNRTFEGGSVRFSASSLNNNSVVPNSGLDRQNFSLAGQINPIKRLTIDARANYILEQAKNRAMLSDGAGNANYNVMFLPTSINVNDLKKKVNADGSEFVYSSNTFATNPWFAAYNFVNDTRRERLLGNVSARYDFDNGLFIQGRVGRDGYTDRYTNVVPSGTAYKVNGSIIEQTTTFSDINVDGLIGKSFKISSDLTISPNIGASYRRTKSETMTNNGANFAVPGVYNIPNSKNRTTTYGVSDQEVNSVYGSLEFDYKDLLYITATARSDWFSTLATPGKDNDLGLVYPSISGSFVFSELLNSQILSFGKLRAGYAVVGQATSPYQTQLNYSFLAATFNGNPLGTVFNTNVPNSSLFASEASELEIGTELKFFNNRLGLDLTWYNKRSENEIVFAPASITTGYQGVVLNAGEMRNRGIEALITATPIKSGDFAWNTSFNTSYNDNEVVSLAAGQEESRLGTSRSGAGFVSNVVGKAFGQVMAFDYKYNPDGSIALTTNGLPDRGLLTPYGSAFHKWIAGWNNDFTYKRFNLGFLVDGKFGGKLFSATDYYGYIFGLHKETLVNREGKFGKNNDIDAATYYSTVANNVSKKFVQDASFIKFRQLTLGYNLPGSLFNNVIKGARISFVGRNLFILMKKTDNIDPESSYSAAVQGLELGGIPPVRSYGFNLNVKF